MPTTGVISKFGVEVVDNNRCDHCLARSWNAWTEQSLLASIEPTLEFVRIQQPLPGSFLSSANEVTLLSRHSQSA